MFRTPNFLRNETRLRQIVAQPNVRNLLWGPETKGLRPMTIAGSTLSTFLGGLLASKTDVMTAEPNTVPESARVTKAEIQALFDLDSSGDTVSDSLKASERLERHTTSMIRDAIYKTH